MAQRFTLPACETPCGHEHEVVLDDGRLGLRPGERAGALTFVGRYRCGLDRAAVFVYLRTRPGPTELERR